MTQSASVPFKQLATEAFQKLSELTGILIAIRAPGNGLMESLQEQLDQAFDERARNPISLGNRRGLVRPLEVDIAGVRLSHGGFSTIQGKVGDEEILFVVADAHLDVNRSVIEFVAFARRPGCLVEA